MARIAGLQQALEPQTPAQAGSARSAAEPSFDAALSGALEPQAASYQSLGLGPLASLMSPATTTAAGGGARALAFAQAEVGVAEQPPGSNDAPRIAEYRAATSGSGIGPWCSYFVSWAARQAGAPLGEAGQGFGAVSSLWGWAERTGRTLPAGSVPQAGDLIVWGGRHIGIVESVDVEGRIHTIEGNSSNAVTRRVHDATGDGATGYVRF